tara:strand:+ start:748 stop:987 length:240 start_codon:yes stop_codon:yes gene_type:complete
MARLFVVKTRRGEDPHAAATRRILPTESLASVDLTTDGSMLVIRTEDAVVAPEPTPEPEAKPKPKAKAKAKAKPKAKAK